MLSITKGSYIWKKSCVRLKYLDEIPYSLIAELCKKISVEDWITSMKIVQRVNYFLRFCKLYYPPKSSKRTFSSGIPQSSAIFKTAWFISGGPQKYNSISSGASCLVRY